MKTPRPLVCWIASLCLYFGVLSPAMAANPFLHQLFTSQMVLQRDASAPVWGWTSAGNEVTVVVRNETGAVNQTKTAVAGTNGRWQVNLDPIPLVTNNAAYSLTISASGETTVTLSNVLLGDVFLCSGQSNMEYTVNNTANPAQEIADSVNYPNIRCFTVPKVPAMTEQETLTSGTWKMPGASTTGGFSATAYFTARELYKRHGVPIGLLSSAWGGTQAQVWVDREEISALADYTQSLFDMSPQTLDSNSVTGLYNGMIHPLAPMRFKAAIWYQGEFNSGRGEQYSRLLPSLMRSWRSLFGQPNLPFLIVQLPNIGAPTNTPITTSQAWAEIREAQLKTVLGDSNSRLVTTIDLGGAIPYVAGADAPLHPLNKQDIGLRACWAAENLVYGLDNVNQGPLFTGATISGSTVQCTFSNVGAGLMVATKNYAVPLTPTQPLVGGTLQGFALAGSDGVFYFANAAITGTNQVTVTSSSVPNPVAVRYGWGQNPPCNLYNQITDASGNVIDGIAASPFRNDPVYRLSVNSGNNSALYPLGTVKSITANTNAGQTFHHWSGDTAFLSSTTSATTNATVGQTMVSVLANYTVTGAPGSLVGRAQVGKVALTWGSMTACHYNIKRATSASGPYVTIASDLGTTTLSYTDSSVTEGTTYYYKVSANNLMGEGPDSSAIAVTVIPTVHDLTATVAEAQVPLSWTAFAGSVDYYRIKRSITSGGPYTTVATTTSLSYVDQSLLAGTTYYYVISAVSGGVESPDCPEIVVNPDFAPTPVSLAHQDIGSVGLTGTASSGDLGTYTVSGGGADIWGTSDGFHFLYQTMTGDGSLTSRVTSIQNTNANAKAGVMMRASLAANSAYAFSFRPGSGNTTYQARSSTGGSAFSIASTGTNQWVRLVRSGNSFTSYTSGDGATWTQLGTAQTINMPATVYVGLAVTSHDLAKLNTSTFEHVSGWPVLAPSTPGGLNASVSGATASLTWNAAPGASSYNIKRSTTSGGPYTTVASGTNTVTHACTGLSAGSTYYYVVSATNPGGESANSAEVCVDLLGLASQPYRPSGFNVNAGNGQAILSWIPSATATSYNIKRSTSPGGPFTLVANTTSALFTDTGLTNATPYYYVISAVNSFGESAETPQVAVTPAIAVAGCTVSANINSKYVTATGTSPLIASKTSVGITEIFAMVDLGSSQIALQSVASGQYVTAPNTTSRLVASRGTIGNTEVFLTGSLTGGKTSLKSVALSTFVAADAAGNSPLIANRASAGAYETFVVSGSAMVATPVGFTAAANDGMTQLSWKPALGATTYSIKRALTSGGPYTEIGTTFDTSFTDPGANGTTYYYVVSGMNNSFATGGPNSTEISASPQAVLAAPSSLQAQALSETQVQLTWVNNAPAATAFVVQRALHGSGNWTTLSTSIAANAGGYTDSTVSAATHYDYRVQCTGGIPASAYTAISIVTPGGIGDGIPGAWRHLYFANGLTLTPASGLNADPDGDGIPNLQEYLGGTNPMNPASAFRIKHHSRNGTNFSLGFDSVAGKTYVVEKTNVLGPNALWTPVFTDIVGTGEEMTITDSSATGEQRLFYRVRIP